ncbi:MAG: cytochrome c3 family protein [Thermoanaerobaculia bacterium]
MRKLMSVAAAFAFLLVTTLASAQQKAPDTVKIDAAAKKQPAVTFPHAQHEKLVKTCDTCHHTNKGLTAANAKDVKKCSDCHLNPTDAKVPSMAEMSMTKNPFHIKCIGCHKAEKKGPAMCKDCHKK